VCGERLRTRVLMLVWDSPRREGVLPAGDIWGNWNVPLVPTDV